MNNITKYPLLGLLFAVVSAMPAAVSAQEYNMGFDSGSGFGDYNMGFDSGSGFGGYNMGWDSGSSDSYNMGYDSGSSPSYNMGWDSGNSGYAGYNMGWDSGSSDSYNMGYDSGSTGTEYGYNPSGTEYGYNPSGTEYGYNPYTGCTSNCTGIEYGYNPNSGCTSNCMGTEYGYNPNSGTEYGYNPYTGTEYGYNPNTGSGTCATCYAYITPAGETVMASPVYTYQTPYYSQPCDCYTAHSHYQAASYVPAASYIPAATYNAFPFAERASLSATYIPSSYSSYVPPIPLQSAPSYSASYVPSNTINTNTNTNSNPSSAFVWSPINNTSTNTNTPIATATNGPITNTNSASTGAITNTFAPVINVNGGGSTQYPVQYTFPRPVCTITTSNVYGYNQPVTLTWSSQNATSAYLSPTGGNVALSGSMVVTITGYTTYTLTVSGQGGSATCQATVNANYPVSTYTPSYTQGYAPQVAAPVTPYVSLSQIPYTGFDYGPVGNAMYWMALLSFAAAAGYLIVYGVPKMSLAGVFARTGGNAYAPPEVAEVFPPVPSAFGGATGQESNLVASTDAGEEVLEVVAAPTPVNTFSLSAVENHR